MKAKISIIVPVYNCSKYLKQCLESLRMQTMDDLEFILVNDGSTDDSLEILKQYKKNDKRFIIINKKNTGYGDSINGALKVANGDFIGIVEPDDFCDKKMFSFLYGLAISNDADIARGGYYEYKNGVNRIHVTKMSVGSMDVFSPLDNHEVFFEPPAIWSAIYRRNLLVENNIEFLPTAGASYQDTGFNFKTLACATKVVYTKKPFYHYRLDNPNSSVNDQNKSMVIVREFKSIENFISGLSESELLLRCCQVAKFGAYHWNLGRLNKVLREKFARVAKREFKEAREQGYLEKSLFPRRYWWSLQLLIWIPIKLYCGLFGLRNTINDIILKR